MTSNPEVGWAPPARIQRQVALPDLLDGELSAVAEEWRSTPAAVIADALFDARERGWTAPVGFDREFERGPTRTITIDSKVLEEMEARLAELRSHGDDADLSFLVSSAALFYLRHRLGHEVEGEPRPESVA